MSLITALVAGCGGAEPVARPNILLISIDALRADHLGCYGYERNTTPVLDSLAAAGTRFANCQSQAPWTLPSHASLLTGLDAVSHGAGYSFGSLKGLDRELTTLPEILSEHGYHTGAIVNVSLLGAPFGFDQGFSLFQPCSPLGSLDATKTVSWAIGFIDLAIDRPEPFFLFVHLWDVHSPYLPPHPYDTLYTRNPPPWGGYWQLAEDGSVVEMDGETLKRERETLMALYDGDIAYTDDQLGRLFGFLRETGTAESTVVIVLSDHGQEFFEHGGTGHGTTLFQEVLRVPLLLSGPGMPVAVVDAPVGLFDVLPTVLSLLDLQAPPGLPGADLLGPTPPVDRMIPSSGIEGMSEKMRTQMIAVRRGTDKLIYDILTGVALVYDLSADPEEQSPRVDGDHSLVAEALDVWSAPPAGDPDGVVDPHEIERIRSLGYLN